MSGGFFEYADRTAKNEIFGWDDKPKNVFEDREISEIVWDVFELIHSFDYYKCGDTGKDTYLRHKADFKKKWLGSNRGLRIKQIIDETVDDARKELYETFGIREDIKE